MKTMGGIIGDINEEITLINRKNKLEKIINKIYDNK